jgi:glucarate dehydratase
MEGGLREVLRSIRRTWTVRPRHLVGLSVMRITDVTVRRINIPLEAPLLWAGGVCYAWTRGIVIMNTDEGVVGIGEMGGGVESVVALEAAKVHFIGQDPFSHGAIGRAFWYLPMYQGTAGKHALNALECCCWDIMGKATNRPIADLIGGARRSFVAACALVFPRQSNGSIGGETLTPELVAFAEAAVEKTGAKTVKVKGGVRDPSEEVETMVALRSAFPDSALRLDSNGAWSAATTQRICSDLACVRLEYLEDPMWGVDALARVQKRIAVPLASNLCALDLETLGPAAAHGVPDVMLLDLADWGGLTICLKAAAVCQAFGIGVGVHSSGEAGVGTALNIHFAAALPVLPFAYDSHYHHQTDDIISQRLEYRDGAFAVPTDPGLGIELDADRLSFLERQFEADGEQPFTPRAASVPGWPGMF